MSQADEFGGKLYRLFRLLNMLAHHPNKSGINAHEAAERLNTTTRTFYRDIQLLTNAGWPIELAPNHRYSLQKNPQLEALIWFTPEEASFLKTATQALTDGNVKNNLLHKLAAFKPTVTDNSLTSNAMAAKIIGSIQEAIDQKKQIELLDYRSLQQARTNNRIVEPIAIINGGRHLFALDLADKNLKMFHINRIGFLRVLNHRFAFEHLHQQPYLDFFGITYLPKKAFLLRVWLSPLAVKLLLEEYPRANQFLKQTNATNQQLLEAPVGILIHAARYFMGLLDEVQVEGPKELVELIKDKLAKTKIV